MKSYLCKVEFVNDRFPVTAFDHIKAGECGITCMEWVNVRGIHNWFKLACGRYYRPTRPNVQYPIGYRELMGLYGNLEKMNEAEKAGDGWRHNSISSLFEQFVKDDAFWKALEDTRIMLIDLLSSSKEGEYMYFYSFKGKLPSEKEAWMKWSKELKEEIENS